MIVLAPLVVVVVLVLVLVVAGKLLYPAAPPYVVATKPSRWVAATEGVVHRGGEAVRRVERGDTLWVVHAGNGLLVIFPDSLGTRALGVGEVLLYEVVGE